MSFAIVGTGKAGRALATLFARKSIEVRIAGRRESPELVSAMRAIGTSVAVVPLPRALEADVVFLAIPFASVPSLAGADWRGKIVVDAMNAREDLGGRLPSDVVAEHLRGARVVKAFNHLPAEVLAQEPAKDGGRRAVFVSSNDDDASRAIQELASRLGFSPIGLGRLDEGGRLLLFRAPLMLHDLVDHEIPKTLRA